ncbi:hypothetical protein D9M71_560350 [compost metagenome]
MVTSGCLPSASSSRSRALAAMASRSRTRPALPCCAMPAVGSSAMSRRFSPAHWSTAGPWASTALTSCCKRPGARVSRCGRWMFATASGTAPWSLKLKGRWRFAWACAWCAAWPRPMPGAWRRRGRSGHGAMSKTCACAPGSTRVPAPNWPMPERCAPWPAIGIRRAGRWRRCSRNCPCSPTWKPCRKAPSNCRSPAWGRT